MRLNGKVAIITGGASGIGAASVRRFLAEGAKVAIADLDFDAAHALASEFGEQCFAMRCDHASATDDESVVAEVVARWGGIDILFNNAAGTGKTTFQDCTDAQLDGMLGSTLLGPWRMTMPAPFQARRFLSTAGCRRSEHGGCTGTPLSAKRGTPPRTYGDHTSGFHHLLKVNPAVKIFTPAEQQNFHTPSGPGLVKMIKRRVDSAPEDMHYLDGKVPAQIGSDSPWPNANFARIRTPAEPRPAPRRDGSRRASVVRTGLAGIRRVAATGPPT